MPKEAPFDAWDGEDLGLTDEVVDLAAEEVAMHVDPDSELEADRVPSWSELADGGDPPSPAAATWYFADEQPDAVLSDGRRRSPLASDEPVIDLEELLERQHYAFPEA
jgi:hypothetical protein